MGFFGNKGRKVVITGTVCQVCGISFTGTDMLARHKVKAHGKVKKDFGLSCPNCLFLCFSGILCDNLESW